MPQNRFGLGTEPTPVARPTNPTSRFGTRSRAEEPVVSEPIDTETPDTQDSGISPLGVAAGVGATGLLAYGLSKLPGRVGSVAKGLDAIRKQLMLSGYALPKSLLGNAGAAVETSIEQGSMRPLKALLSRQTLDDAVNSYKTQSATGLQHGMNLPGPVPGKIMGAIDTATQGALQRAGLGAEEAQAAVLQRPLGGRFKSFEGPVAQYLFPFRRTPFNQLFEGLDKMDVAKLTPGETRALMVYMGGGAVHGAATADEDVPVSLPFAVAASARHGLPYGLAAMVGRYAAGGGLPGSGIASSLLPVSEYGLESSIDPTKPFRKPAITKWWED